MEICIACNSNQVQKNEQINGYIEGSIYSIYSCIPCGTKWATPHTEDPAVYNLIYNNDDTPGYMRYKEYAKDILYARKPFHFLLHKEEMYYSVLKSIKKNVKNGGKILDVGCGLGYLTYALAKAGYKATGLDISSSAVDQAKERYGEYFICKDFFTFNGIEGGFDAICMLELIEHVTFPKEYIEHAISLLGPKGILIITTPNRSWYPANSLWETDLPPVHLTWFSEKGIELLAQRLHLSVTFFPFSFYNFFYGTLRKPTLPSSSVRNSFFSTSGTPLYSHYVKSSLRGKAEKLHVYSFIKKIQHIIRKIQEYLSLLIEPSSVCIDKSNIICVIVRPTS